MAIRFHYQTDIRIKEVRKIKSFLPIIFKQEKVALESLDYIFCDDNYILTINQQFLSHDYYTDIISFDMTAPGNREIVGEIYISIETVSSNAVKYGTPFAEELLRVIFHGALHLCGYGDKTISQKKQMRSKEEFYLKLFSSNI